MGIASFSIMVLNFVATIAAYYPPYVMDVIDVIDWIDLPMDPQVQQLLELLNWKSFYGISDNVFASLQTILKTNIPTGNAL